MYNVSARGISIPNAVIGMACFVGGLAQFAAGMWGMSATAFRKVPFADLMTRQNFRLVTPSARPVSIILQYFFNLLSALPPISNLSWRRVTFAPY